LCRQPRRQLRRVGQPSGRELEERGAAWIERGLLERRGRRARDRRELRAAEAQQDVDRRRLLSGAAWPKANGDAGTKSTASLPEPHALGQLHVGATVEQRPLEAFEDGAVERPPGTELRISADGGPSIERSVRLGPPQRVVEAYDLGTLGAGDAVD